MIKSFIVTGASASGKTTLINEAIHYGYRCLPTHTTRSPRLNEINGIHNVFLSRQDYEQNFSRGLYMEPSLEYAENNGVYYGTPIEWLETLSKDGYCAIPITPQIAEQLCKLSGVLWISLSCNDTIRKNRLIARGISEKELEARLMTAEDHQNLPQYVRIFDTEKQRPSEILSIIMQTNR